MLIDSHCHLNHEKFGDTSPTELIQRARDAGVTGMLTICTNITNEFDDILNISRSHDDVWCTIGTHPSDASDPNELNIDLDTLIDRANSDSNIIGIGETGLDFYYDYAKKDDQIQSFRKHLQACIETDLPVIIHARDADEKIMSILQEEGTGTNLKGVMHCFSSGLELAKFALDIGFYISFSGIVTFKNAHDLREVAKAVPMDRMFVETDAPYLAPVPYRGKQNEPAYVAHTSAYLADMFDVDDDLFNQQVSQNFCRLFDIVPSVY